MPSPVMGLLGAAMMGDEDDAAHSSSSMLGGGIHGWVLGWREAPQPRNAPGSSASSLALIAVPVS